ncbi:MAG: HEAT repeat domain-containing protein [Anaerolineae bacterium]|jgi:hypothetical protein|nr:HEAT repeat domain-containing protein [Anaerolineae bacterium]MBT7781623.1 HEAT repeat domain-containing protein [Anaerolineae bacterium]
MNNPTQENLFDAIERACDDRFGPSSPKSIFRNISEVLAKLPDDVSFTAEFLEKRIRSSDLQAKRAIAALLGLIDIENDINILLELLDEKDVPTRIRAIASLGRKTLSDCPDKLLAQLDENDSAIREQAVVTIGTIKDEKAFIALLKSFNDTDDSVKDEVVRQLANCTQITNNSNVLVSAYKIWVIAPIRLKRAIIQWISTSLIEIKIKLHLLVDTIKESLITFDEFDSKIIHAVARDSNGNTFSNIVADEIIEIVSSQDFESRELNILSSLLLELLGGRIVGEKLAVNLIVAKRNTLKDTASGEVINRLNLFINSTTRGHDENEILGKLQEGFQANYVEVAAILTTRTMKEWETTVAQAKSGFAARLWMNIIMFSLGVSLTLVSIFLLLSNNLAGLESFFGIGTSLLAGIITMASTLFFGPLREIAKSVADVGVINTTLIGYIHRILQISHTFEYLYLTQRIDLESLRTLNKHIDDATQKTADNLFTLIDRKQDDKLNP